MDINKDINEYFKNDIILLIMDFLYSLDYIDSLITIEKETKLSIFTYNKELSFLRKLIIEGNWEEAENFLLPLKSNINFEYNSAIKLLKLQKLFEITETQSINLDQNEIESQLKDIDERSVVMRALCPHELVFRYTDKHPRMLIIDGNYYCPACGKTIRCMEEGLPNTRFNNSRVISLPNLTLLGTKKVHQIITLKI